MPCTIFEVEKYKFTWYFQEMVGMHTAYSAAVLKVHATFVTLMDIH